MVERLGLQERRIAVDSFYRDPIMVTTAPLPGNYLCNHHRLSNSVVGDVVGYFLAPSGHKSPPCRCNVKAEIEPERAIGYGSFGAVW